MEENTEIKAMADLLAEVIAFLLPYKDKIIEAILTYNRNFYMYESEVVVKDISAIRKQFKANNAKSSNLIELVIRNMRLIKALDEMIGIQIGALIDDSIDILRDTDFVTFEKGLNSDESRAKTSITIIPRFKTSWEGSGEDREIVSDSFNRMMNSTRYVELQDELVGGKYIVNGVIICRNMAIHRENRTRDRGAIRIGMCPMALDFNLQGEENRGIYFYQKAWRKKDIDRINVILYQAIKKAEDEKLNILVFPEMLGYPKIENQAYEYMRDVDCKYLKLVVLPSVWETVDGKGSNTAYLVHAGRAAMILSQGKLVAFNNNKVKEAIEPAREINLLLDEIHGCLGVLICKSELEDSVRDIFVRDLGVKLILCPSWSSGIYPFETTALANAQWNANMIWTNTCSAFKSKAKKKLMEQPVCIATHYCKVPGMADLQLEKFYPLKNCNKECKNGELCLFITEIKGKE